MTDYRSYPFTLVPDVDREILMRTKKQTLRQACMVDEYARSLCSPTFWRRRFEKDYGRLDERNPPSELVYDYRRAFYHVYDEDMQRTLNHAIRDGNIPLALWAYEKRKEEEIKEDPELYRLTQDLLSWTIRSKNVNMARALLKEIDLAKITGIGDYIDIAAKNNDLPMVRYFLEERNVDYRPKYYFLEELVLENAIDVIIYLIDRLGDYVDEYTRQRLLRQTMRYYGGSGIPPLLRYLVEEQKIDLHTPEMRIAAESVETIDLLRYYVDHGVDVTVDPDNMFRNAIFRHILPIVRYLVEELGMRASYKTILLANTIDKEIANYLNEKFSTESRPISKSSDQSKASQVAKTNGLSKSVANMEDVNVLDGLSISINGASRRCIAITLAGTQCKKMAIAGSDYCSIHAKK